MRHKQAIGPILTCMLALVTLSAASAVADDLVDLTGTWTINEHLSDDPASVLRDAAGDRSGNSGGLLRRIGRSVSVFGIPVGSLPLPSGGSAPSSDEEPSHADYTVSAIDELRIIQDAQATEFDYGSTELVIHRHGVVTETDDASILADWSRRGFVIEHELENGTEITETYRLDTSSDQLHWTVRVKAKKAKAVEIDRVYDRAARPGLNFVAAL